MPIPSMPEMAAIIHRENKQSGKMSYKRIKSWENNTDKPIESRKLDFVGNGVISIFSVISLRN